MPCTEKSFMVNTSDLPVNLEAALRELLAAVDPMRASAAEFLAVRFDHGLAWLHFPVGLGGLDMSRRYQIPLEQRLVASGAAPADIMRNPIGLGMAAPTLRYHGTPQQQQRHLRPLWTGDEVWCQLFSEPGAGSDLAGLSTRAVRDADGWIVNGHKVWTSLAHLARWGLLLARTDPAAPKHEGLSYFIVDMQSPGVQVKPLRQATGQAEFNEVLLTDVRLPDDMRLGAVGEGWTVARTTLLSERSTIAGQHPREEGHIATLAELWRGHPELRTVALHHEVLSAWIEAEVSRLANQRSAQKITAGLPGYEGAAAKVMFAANNQRITAITRRLDADAVLLYDCWDLGADSADADRCANFDYLRARANSIEGGTTEILLGQIADRVLDLPREPKIDPSTPWQELPHQ